MITAITKDITINIRDLSLRDIGDILPNTQFTGSGLQKIGTVDYIVLETVAGKPVTGYVSTLAKIDWKTVDTPPVTTSSFPDSFILENPKTGERAEYIFVKVL